MFRKIVTKQQAVVASRVFRASTSTSTTTAATATRSFSAAPPAAVAQPSVKDMLIDLTFVDPSGARRKAKGMIGKSLFEVCEWQGIDLGPSSCAAPPEVARTETWIEPTFGEGTCSGFDHVVLVGKGRETAARVTPIEEQMLEDNWDWDEIFEGSRLASAVVLTKDMDGMTVYVPDRIVDDAP